MFKLGLEGNVSIHSNQCANKNPELVIMFNNIWLKHDLVSCLEIFRGLVSMFKFFFQKHMVTCFWIYLTFGGVFNVDIQPNNTSRST